PNGIRTRVTAVKGRCPGPLDDRVVHRAANIPFVLRKANCGRNSPRMKRMSRIRANQKIHPSNPGNPWFCLLYSEQKRINFSEDRQSIARCAQSRRDGRRESLWHWPPVSRAGSRPGEDRQSRSLILVPNRLESRREGRRLNAQARQNSPSADRR